MHRTTLGRFDQLAWGHLRHLGYVESYQDASGDGVRLTDAGRAAVQRGLDERASLLERCRRASGSPCGPQDPDGTPEDDPSGYLRLAAREGLVPR